MQKKNTIIKKTRYTVWVIPFGLSLVWPLLTPQREKWSGK